MWPFRKKEPPLPPAALPASDPAAVEYEHYRVLRRDNDTAWELGHGAMGITYKAEDTNLRVPVALKVISPLIAEQPGARELFLSEARGAASLRHRNAAAVHHLGVSRAGELFFAMEFIAGETVETLIRRQRRIGINLALNVAQQTACALAAAGLRGVVHRDLKPANLMLCNEGDGTIVVKVIDFGLCKQLPPVKPPEGKRKPVKSESPAIGQFLGTPHYASPEQIRGDADVDGRADFYSLGATLWTMLAGQPVFQGPLASIRQRHLEETPHYDELPAEVSAPVRSLLASLLEKTPAARPQTPLDLIDRIEAAAFEHRGVDNDPRRRWKTEGCVPLVGTLLAHNYHLEALLDEDQIVSRSPIFRAEDIAGQRTVAVQLLDREMPLDALRTAVERLAGAPPQPHLVQNLAFSTCRGQPFIVNEWLNGFTLAEVLRARAGVLTPPEVEILVDQAQVAVDHASGNGLDPLDLRTATIQAHFTGQNPPDARQRRELASQPVTAWPEFILKFRLQPPSETVEDPGRAAVPDGTPAQGAGLCQLAGELLGSARATTTIAERPRNLYPR